MTEPIAARVPNELNDALYDLQQATDEASGEGFPAPSDIALGNAGRLLREMYGISPRRFEVYPAPDGEIAIDAPGIPLPGCFPTVFCVKPWPSWNMRAIKHGEGPRDASRRRALASHEE